MQDTHVELKTNRKSSVAYRMAPLQVTFNDLEGHFAVETFVSIRVHDGALRSNMQCRQQHYWYSTFVNHSYGPVDINKIGYMEFC